MASVATKKCTRRATNSFDASITILIGGHRKASVALYVFLYVTFLISKKAFLYVNIFLNPCHVEFIKLLCRPLYFRAQGLGSRLGSRVIS